MIKIRVMTEEEERVSTQRKGDVAGIVVKSISLAAGTLSRPKLL